MVSASENCARHRARSAAFNRSPPYRRACCGANHFGQAPRARDHGMAAQALAQAGARSTRGNDLRACERSLTCSSVALELVGPRGRARSEPLCSSRATCYRPSAMRRALAAVWLTALVLFAPSAWAQVWQSVGPNGGDITALSADLSNPSRVY